MTRVLRLTFLTPDIVESILHSRQRPEVTLAQMPSNTGHRVDTDLKPKGLPPHDGGKERGPGIAMKTFGPFGSR